MTTLVERVAAEVRRREPLQVRQTLLELAARLVYTPAWLIGRVARGLVAAARFVWAAARVGISDGYGTKTLT